MASSPAPRDADDDDDDDDLDMQTSLMDGWMDDERGYYYCYICSHMMMIMLTMILLFM